MVTKAVILPYYDVVSASLATVLKTLASIQMLVGVVNMSASRKLYDGVTFFFIDNEQYFNRGTVHGEWDDGMFGFFQMAAWVDCGADFIPDIFHVHDYHTAMIPFLLKEKYHNSSYQGIYQLH